MKKIRLLALLLLGLLVGGTAYAQGRVSGVVKSSEDGQPLVGVVVQLKGTSVAVLTSGDGAYTISNASVGTSTLVFTYAGMSKREVAVAGKTTVNVTLQPSALQADAVTVTAMGGKKQDRALGYATATVKGEDLARTNSISPINALQGKVAGLNIGVSGSSGLTGNPMVTLRGAKSLDKNNSPIYVIDGIVMTNETSGGDDGNKNNMYGNQLKNLNSSDYEDITVLKGAAATSLYGSRGANGAIVITTKGGTSRKGIGVDVSYSHEFTSTYASPIELQNKYGMGSPTNGAEGGILGDTGSSAKDGIYTGSSFGPALDQGIMMRQNYKLWENREAEGYEYNPSEEMVSHPNNWDDLFQSAMQNNVNVALTGGSDKATFRLSYGYTDRTGELPNNEFNRHSINFRTNGQINDIFSVDFSMQYSNSKTLNANFVAAGWYEGATNYANLVSTSLSRNTDLQWFRDNYINPENWERMVVGGPTASGNLESLQTSLNKFEDQHVERQEQTIISRVGINAQFNDWLDASASISYNNFSYNDETKNWGSDIYRGGDGNKYAISGHTEGSYNGLVSVHSNNSFVDDNLTLDVRVFGEIYGNQAGANYQKSTVGGLKVPGVFSFANTKDPIGVDELKVDWNRRNDMVVGIGAAATLGWKDQLYLEVTGRNDWLSSLLYPTWMPTGADNYSVFYPSVNLSWVFSDTFQIDPNILSFGKLRASFAQVGSGTSAYSTTKGAGGFEFETWTPVSGGDAFAATPNDGTLANYDLKPEIQQSIEFGADLRFLNSRIGLDVAYYKINTKNQILSLAAVKESGVEHRLINAGNIQNQGWEVAMSFVPIRNNTVNWNIGLIWSRNKSKIIELHPDITKQEFYGGGTQGAPKIIAVEGGAFGQIVAGEGYGSPRTQAHYYDFDNANNPLNGSKALRYTTSDNMPVTVYQTNNNMYSPDHFNEDGGKVDFYGEHHEYDVLGNVEADFNTSLTTNLQINLPNSSGSIDLFAQIDGRIGGSMISTTSMQASASGTTESTMYGRDAENGGVERVNYKGDLVNNGMVLDGTYGAKDKMLVQTLNGTGDLDKDGKDVVGGGYVDLRGHTMQGAIDAGYIAPMYSALFHQTSNNHGVIPTQDLVHDYSYLSLREVTVGYNLPEKWIKTLGLQTARVSFSARNLCYLYNTLPNNMNPESLSSNNPLVPVDMGGVPFNRNFSINVNLRF